MTKYTLKLEEKRIKEALNKIYIEKTIERLEKLKKDINFSSYFDSDFFINKKHIKSLNELKKILLNLVDELQINK